MKRPHGNQETVSEPSRANARTHLLTVILTTELPFTELWEGRCMWGHCVGGSGVAVVVFGGSEAQAGHGMGVLAGDAVTGCVAGVLKVTGVRDRRRGQRERASRMFEASADEGMQTTRRDRALKASGLVRGVLRGVRGNRLGYEGRALATEALL